VLLLCCHVIIIDIIIQYGGWWRLALISPDGVAPSQMVVVSPSVNLPLHHKVQKFSSGTISPRWSRKKGHKTVVVWYNIIIKIIIIIIQYFYSTYIVQIYRGDRWHVPCGLWDIMHLCSFVDYGAIYIVCLFSWLPYLLLFFFTYFFAPCRLWGCK